MNVERCAVPNCKNPATTGIPFPKEIELQEKWLKSLKITDFVPTDGSFVCLDHFGDGDVLERLTDTDLENVLEELPIPVIFEKSKITLNISSETCEEIQQNIKEVIGTESENNGESLLCRLCMCKHQDQINIFDSFNDGITIADAILSCIPKIKIFKNDQLSKSICNNCLEILRQFYNFQERCMKMDKQQRENFRQSRKRKAENFLVTSIKKHYDESESDIQTKSVVDRKFDYVEAELMRALEGKLTEEMKSADNIIIEVQSDEDNDDSQPVCVSSVEGENVVRVGSDEVRLPKGIKVNVNQPKIEISNVLEVQGNQNVDFCVVESYIFEYRLCKGNIRHLKCIYPKCKSTAQQTMLEPGIFENKVYVKHSHNHPTPSEEEGKKQMFLHLMRRKMQTDKTLNIRNVYEEFCEKNPEIRKLVPLKTVINQVCSQQINLKTPTIHSFNQFYDLIENDEFEALHFTLHSNVQFYQEKLTASDGSKAVIFANCETLQNVVDSKIMYVDASFNIETNENFNYHLVSILVWVTDSYYPIMFALISEKSQELYKQIFTYLQRNLAPKLRPEEIVTDYEASLYYSLGEVYSDSHIGGSVFYYTQNLYKKICSLNLSRELETNSCFRNIYHMILMLPLLPVNTVVDGLTNIELQAAEMGQAEQARPIFEFVKSQWIEQVTPDLFCVHRLENRINENVIAPFKKLRDFLMLSKGKMTRQHINIVTVVQKLIELEGFLSNVYSAPSKKSFARDLSSSQKKNVIRAWHFIESHPKININNFFTKVLGYIKCMENQLWIWGFYRYNGDANDELINASNFSIVNTNENEDHNYDQQTEYVDYVYHDGDDVVDVIINQKDGFLVKENQIPGQVELESQNSFAASYIE